MDRELADALHAIMKAAQKYQFRPEREWFEFLLSTVETDPAFSAQTACPTFCSQLQALKDRLADD
jgi:hypothetical protein